MTCALALIIVLLASDGAASAVPPTAAETSPPSTTTPAPDAAPAIQDSVLVTATRTERSLSKLPVSATVVREEEIRKAPVRSVDDLIRSVPGVTPSVISSSGSTPTNQRFSMHGLGGIRALVLLDGVPLHEPYSGNVQWQNVPLDTLRQIEVVRGGNASLFGNFALGGTVNLVTRSIDRNEVALDLSRGSNATGRAALRADFVINSVLSLRLNHHQSDSNGFLRVPDPGPVDIEAWTDNTITSAQADLHLSDRTSGFLKASASKIDVSQGTPLTYSKRDLASFSTGLHHAIGSSALISANAYYQRESERLVNSSIVGQRVSELLTQDALIPSSGKGASAEWTMQLPGKITFVSIGVDLQQVEATENRVAFGRTGAVTQREQVGGRQNFTGIFAQASWQPIDRIEVLASARLDSFRNEGGRDVIAGGTATNYEATSSNQLDPRISMRYALGSRSAIRGSVYRAFNAPTLRDLYRNNQSGNSIILGNPDLQPETLEGGEIGGEWSNGNVRVEMNLYRSTIDGLQSRVIVSGNTFRFLNLGTARSQGVELMGDFRMTRHWSLNAGYTFADSTVVSDPDPKLIGNLLPEVSRNSGSLALRYRGAHGTTMDVRGLVMSRSYGDASNLAKSPGHQIVDVSVSQTLRSWLDAYAILENAFDEKYYLALAATSFRRGLPRTFTAGIRVNFPTGRID